MLWTPSRADSSLHITNYSRVIGSGHMVSGPWFSDTEIFGQSRYFDGMNS